MSLVVLSLNSTAPGGKAIVLFFELKELLSDLLSFFSYEVSKLFNA